MANVYFTADFGGVPILIADISTERGRDVAVQSPSHGDEHSLNDRGRRLRRSSVEILFVDQPGLAPYTERYERFLALAEGPDAQVFTHPLDGSYRARAEGLTVSASKDELAIRVSCTISRDAEPTSVFPVAAGGSVAAGVESVTVAGDQVDAELEAVGLSSSTPAATVAAITAWDEADELDSAMVYLEVASLTQQIDEMIAELELATQLDRWPAYRAAILLRYELTRAAEAFTSDVEQIVDLYVEVARPVRAIAAEVYGGRDADERTAQIVKLNRIRAPGRVAPGTTLKIPRPAA